MAASGPETTPSSTTPTGTLNELNRISPWLALFVGLALTIGLGLLAFLDKILSVDLFAGIVTAYAITGTVLGVYLLQNNGVINGAWKFVVLIVASVIGFAFGQYANIPIVNVVSISAFIILVASFAMEEIQAYAPNLPASWVNDATLVIGGVVVIAQAVQNAPAGTMFSVSSVITLAIPAILMYIVQKWTPGSNNSLVALVRKTSA